jgi:hypothetical protein
MRKDGRIRFAVWVLLVITALTIGWSADAYALERRVGSLEYSYDSSSNPIGLVMLNYISEKKPYISYDFPVSAGGNFTTPWGMLIDATGAIIGDTLIMATNPSDSLSLDITITLRNADGVIEDLTNCIATITLGPKATKLRASRTLFSGCPTVAP